MNCLEKKSPEANPECKGRTIELNPGSACPAPLICPLPTEPPSHRLKKPPQPALVALTPHPDEAAQQHLVQNIMGSAQEHQKLQADLQAGVDQQQMQLADMRAEQYKQSNKPLRMEEVQFARSMDPEADDLRNPPCYLPQQGDELPHKDQLMPMGPIGPWASGKVDWSPMAGITGTRPVVDRYSITRYSPNEWRTRNHETVQVVNASLGRADKNRFSSTTEFLRLSALVDKSQKETTDKLRIRSQLIGKWKNTLENAIKAMADEISTMEVERIKLRKSMVVLGVPESIAKECIEKRATRPDTELVRDQVEEELVNELALIAEIRRLLMKTLDDFNSQQVENRTARQRLEYDWSDKKESYEIDTINTGLNNCSRTIMFRPGAVRQPPEQASEKYWEHFSMETLDECEKCRLKSVALRNTLNSTLMNAARDIRTQADVVEKALTSRINCTQEAVQRFENDLKNILQGTADVENRIEQMKRRINSFDSSMKVAQTRMDNRSYRPNVENCRDLAQQELIDGVHTIQSSVSALLHELEEAERVKTDLVNSRARLEREIMLKRRSLFIDRERCMLMRSYYPSANTLSGAATS
uniref:Tektin n=1 Tax=Drosophila melanogaster TaxID=7227 RepID=Q9V3M9_DROME|nr:tektin A, isoform B [Drosophila melanogaster]NP_523577.1 tektin A, isoform A [Drosophila melanogaster]ACL90149.1 Tektin-A-PA [synthetic construct]AAF53488.1 tektin A, isoform A [Drosophila melanogaster]AAL13627.1 GH16413p [Drosophila melanogaster]AGB93011.1 tektin A, isoform B [Drosophila melanogaster]|eukprot:NP_001260476.1 tektin A, isoform B [Drosophila melanogaster]